MGFEVPTWRYSQQTGVPICYWKWTPLVNNTTASHEVSVPEGWVYKIQLVSIYNADDVARACYFQIWKTSGRVLISQLARDNALASGAYLTFPNSGTPCTNLIVDDSFFFRFIWVAGGASAGGVDGLTSIIADGWKKET